MPVYTNPQFDPGHSIFVNALRPCFLPLCRLFFSASVGPKLRILFFSRAQAHSAKRVMSYLSTGENIVIKNVGTSGNLLLASIERAPATAVTPPPLH